MYCATLCEEWQSAENTVSHEVIMYICAELHVTRYEDRHTSKSLHFFRPAIPQNYDKCENNRKQVKNILDLIWNCNLIRFWNASSQYWNIHVNAEQIGITLNWHMTRYK